MRRVVVTGLGAITPLGVGIRRAWTKLLAGESGIVNTLGLQPTDRWKELPSTVAGLVPEGNGEGLWNATQWLGGDQVRHTSKFGQYAIAASEMALKDAGLEEVPEKDRRRTGVCLGSSVGSLNDVYDMSLAHHAGGYKKVPPFFAPKMLMNMSAGQISMKYGLQGPIRSPMTACAAGAHSIGDASVFITTGYADMMVAGASESCIHPIVFSSFGRARALSTAYNDNPRASCRPFDSKRSGFVMAEGAAICVLEELEHAKARGAQIYAEIKGYGLSGDAHHMTAPREDGLGAYLAMEMALETAGIKPSQVDYINAHGTGTQVGDVAEARAIRNLMLGDGGVSDESKVTVSSTKGATGHMLGAAGAIEALFSILAIHEGVAPPTLNLEEPDVGVGFNFVPLKAQQKRIETAVSNSFGFGGTNGALVFSKFR